MPIDGSFSFSFFILHSTFPSGWAVGAVVAQLLYTETVGGSNPSSPTSLRFERSEKRRLPRRSEAQAGEWAALLRATARQASPRQRRTKTAASWRIARRRAEPELRSEIGGADFQVCCIASRKCATDRLGLSSEFGINKNKNLHLIPRLRIADCSLPTSRSEA